MTVKRFAQGMIVPSLCVMMIGYFSYHAIYGQYGAFMLTRLDERVELRMAELQTVSTERDRMEKRVQLFQPGRVDPDMLDEQSRTSLGFSRPDELTIFYDNATH